MRRYTIAEYHALIADGVLTTDDRVELLEGELISQARQSPPHCSTLNRLGRVLLTTLPGDWQCRVRSGVTLADSEPEPDLAVVRGGPRTYSARHPGPADFGIAIAVSDTTLAADRADKGRIFARNGLPEYWVVNLPDEQVEVYTDPRPGESPPRYATRTDYPRSAAVPLALDGVAIARIPVADLLP